MNRRGFLMGLGGAVLAAPAIVRVAANLMPIHAPTVYSLTHTADGWIILRNMVGSVGGPIMAKRGAFSRQYMGRPPMYTVAESGVIFSSLSPYGPLRMGPA